jgi:hypothetical protein
VKANYESKNFSAYIAALKAHKSKVVDGKRTNRASLWHKADAARLEMQAGPIVTSEELTAFWNLTEAEAAK